MIEPLTEPMQRGQDQALPIASEAPGWYWFHLFQTLSQAPFLTQWPLELYRFNPRLTAHFKPSYSQRDKTDLSDAFVGADRFRFGRDLPVPFGYAETYLPLRFLTRYYLRLTPNLVREKAYALAMLYLKARDETHPDKAPFPTGFGAASQAVLAEFASLDQIAALDFSDRVEFSDVKANRRFPDPETNARKLQQVVQDSYA